MTKIELTQEATLFELEKQSNLLANLIQVLTSETRPDIPEWVNIHQCAQLKGGMTSDSLFHRPWQQPCCGTKWVRVNGNKVWQKAEVLKWLTVNDNDLEKYAAEYGVDISKFFKDGKTVRIGA